MPALAVPLPSSVLALPQPGAKPAPPRPTWKHIRFSTSSTPTVMERSPYTTSLWPCSTRGWTWSSRASWPCWPASTSRTLARYADGRRALPTAPVCSSRPEIARLALPHAHARARRGMLPPPPLFCRCKWRSLLRPPWTSARCSAPRTSRPSSVSACPHRHACCLLGGLCGRGGGACLLLCCWRRPLHLPPSGPAPWPPVPAAAELDTDRDGLITVQELQDALQECNIRWGDVLAAVAGGGMRTWRGCTARRLHALLAAAGRAALQCTRPCRRPAARSALIAASRLRRWGG